MSETETETTPDETTPDETETPETTPDTETEEADEEEARRAEEEALARVRAASDADLTTKLKRAKTDNRKRLEKLLGIQLEGRECPVCEGNGYVTGEPDPSEQMVHPDNLAMCEYCNGFGHVVTGSRNEAHFTAPCPECAGWGYKTLAAQPQNVTPLTPPAPSAQAAQMGQLLPDGSFLPFGATEPIRVTQAG